MDAFTLCVLAVLALLLLIVAIGFALFIGQSLHRGEASHYATETETAVTQQASALRQAYDERVKSEYGDIFKPGLNFDASAVAPRLQQVRQDYVRELQTHPKPIRHQASLVAAAKQAITNLPFFRNRKESDPSLTARHEDEHAV